MAENHRIHNPSITVIDDDGRSSIMLCKRTLNNNKMKNKKWSGRRRSPNITRFDGRHFTFSRDDWPLWKQGQFRYSFFTPFCGSEKFVNMILSMNVVPAQHARIERFNKVGAYCQENVKMSFWSDSGRQGRKSRSHIGWIPR